MMQRDRLSLNANRWQSMKFATIFVWLSIGHNITYTVRTLPRYLKMRRGKLSFNANRWQSIKFATTFQVSSVWLSIVHRLPYPSRCQLTESNRVLWIDRSIFRPSISSTVQALQPLHISSKHTPEGRRTPIWKVGGWMCLDWNRPIRTWLNLCLTQIISF